MVYVKQSSHGYSMSTWLDTLSPSLSAAMRYISYISTPCIVSPHKHMLLRIVQMYLLTLAVFYKHSEIKWGPNWRYAGWSACEVGRICPCTSALLGKLKRAIPEQVCCWLAQNDIQKHPKGCRHTVCSRYYFAVVLLSSWLASLFKLPCAPIRPPAAVNKGCVRIGAHQKWRGAQQRSTCSGR